MQSDFSCSKRTSETLLFLWFTTPTRCVRHDPWDRVNILEICFTHNQYDSRLSGKSPRLVKERSLHEIYFLGGYQQTTWIQKHDCFSIPSSITFRKKMVKIWPGFQPLTLPKFNMEPKNDGFQVRIFWGISEYHFRQAKKKSGEPKVECLKLLEAKNQKNMIVFLVGGWTNPFKNMPWS